jgi:hypothetical protein
MIQPWFDPNLYSWIPGTVLGVAGGVIGTLAGVLAPRGKAEQLITALFVIALAASLALLIGGIVALATGQPYGIWYGLGLPGLIGLVVFGMTFGQVRRRYQDTEMRRMRAADLG